MYTPLSDKEGSEQEHTTSETPLLEEGGLFSGKKRRHLTRYGYWILYFGSIVAISGLLHGIQQSLRKNGCECWDRFNAYSPVNDAVAPYPYVHREFNGSLWYQSPFKGPPTPEVEKAWYDIMKYGMISVTKTDIEMVKHPDWSAQFPPEAGGGYIAATIGSHQLHCLHYIWQDHYMTYFPKTQDKAQRVPELYERHYEHCVDYIRQSLMCQFDTGIIPYTWVLDHQNPTPNAYTHHKCVDWDALQTWLGNRTVQVPEGFKWHQPKDAVTMSYNP